MKALYGRKGLVAVSVSGVALLAALFAASPSAAQEKAAKKTNEKKYCIGCSVDGKTTPRTADGHPDLSGFWGGGEATGGAAAEGGRGSVFQRSDDGSILFDIGTEFNVRKLCHDPILNVEDTCQDPNQPSYKPEYMAKVKEIAAQEYRGTTPLDPQMDCRPMGLPRAGATNMQIFQTPQAVAILYASATGSVYRIIYTDGRPHPADLDTSFMGDSIGHWEGDTLVVDVTGLNDETWLAGGVATTLKYANIHSDQEHVVERYSRDGDVLTYQATVEDPVMFTKPWVLAPRHIRHAGPSSSADGVLEESICTINDKAHFVKPTDDQTKCAYRCSAGDVTVTK